MTGYEQEKYIPPDFTNVTLTILEGTVACEPEVPEDKIGQSYKLTSKDHIEVVPGTLHKVINIGERSAFYMYTFFNKTKDTIQKNVPKSKLPIFKELQKRFHEMIIFGNLIVKNVFQIFRYSRCN